MGYEAVAFAAHGSPTVTYPDCRPEFADAAGEACRLGNEPPVAVLAPFARWMKSDIVRRRADLRVPLGETWSCYCGGHSRCGRCTTCDDRRKAFALARVDEPTFLRDTLAWVEAVGVGDELEPDEWEVIQRPPGRLDERAQTDAACRLEGLAVLAWSLGRFDLPPYDELVAPQALIRSLGFPDAEAARTLLARPSFRPPDELEALRKQLLGLHWRLRDFRLRPQAMDFEAFARDCWFGPMDIGPFRLVGGDLALGGRAIGDAPEDVLGMVSSAAMERHKAVN